MVPLGVATAALTLLAWRPRDAFVASDLFADFATLPSRCSHSLVMGNWTRAIGNLATSGTQPTAHRLTGYNLTTHNTHCPRCRQPNKAEDPGTPKHFGVASRRCRPEAGTVQQQGSLHAAPTVTAYPASRCTGSRSTTRGGIRAHNASVQCCCLPPNPSRYDAAIANSCGCHGSRTMVTHTCCVRS